jgi:PPK2 family polyphosphate:nucleotide phosphotransferase
MGQPYGFTYRVKPGETVRLASIATDEKAGLTRGEGKAQTAKLGAELTDLQELLYGASTHSALIVLQGMDTSGKDGTIRHALRWLNPQACRVTSFKAPTPEESAHDFLWRIHAATPPAGFVAIFNRSHYEDVLVPRVDQTLPKSVWSARYERINAFERLLTDTGTIVLKFFLHISRKEQHKRLLKREENPDKAWKVSVSDWQAREHWDAYMEAYEELLTRCSTDAAPWHIVAADHKWFRNLAVTSTVVETLQEHKPMWQKQLLARGRAELARLREYHAAREGQAE